MPKPKRPRDPSQLGKLLVDIASGEKKWPSKQPEPKAKKSAKPRKR